jgi:endonuclease-8
VALGYRLGVCELLPTAAEERVVASLGPDPLDPGWDPGEAVRRLAADPGRAVGAALLDQRLIAGPGNVYRNEALFLRGLHPWRPVGRIGDLDRLVDLVARLMRANRATAAQVTTGDPRPGRKWWVTQRARLPCRRCGTPIRTGRQGAQAGQERVTFWCPSCQPEAGHGVLGENGVGEDGDP